MYLVNAPHGGIDGLGLAVILSLAWLTTAALAGLGIASFRRRGSRSYLLIALALVALFARTVVAATAVLGVFGATPHHLVEHGLDTMAAALVIGAVYYARSVGEARTAGG